MYPYAEKHPCGEDQVFMPSGGNGLPTPTLSWKTAGSNTSAGLHARPRTHRGAFSLPPQGKEERAGLWEAFSFTDGMYIPSFESGFQLNIKTGLHIVGAVQACTLTDLTCSFQIAKAYFKRSYYWRASIVYLKPLISCCQLNENKLLLLFNLRETSQ